MPKSKVTLTYDLAFASGTDAGNRSMRKAGRKAWNTEDRHAAARELQRLFPDIIWETNNA